MSKQSERVDAIIHAVHRGDLATAGRELYAERPRIEFDGRIRSGELSRAFADQLASALELSPLPLVVRIAPGLEASEPTIPALDFDTLEVTVRIAFTGWFVIGLFSVRAWSSTQDPKGFALQSAAALLRDFYRVGGARVERGAP